MHPNQFNFIFIKLITMPVIDLMWLVTTSSIMVFLADLQQIFEFFRAMTRNLGFKQQFLVNPTVSWLLWSMHGLNIEEFQSKKKKDWFPTVFGVLLLILLSTVPGKEYGLTKRLENVDVIRATPAIVILQTRKLLFDVHLFIRLYKYLFPLHFTTHHLLPVAHEWAENICNFNIHSAVARGPASKIFTLPQTFLVRDSIWRPANKNIQKHPIYRDFRRLLF